MLRDKVGFFEVDVEEGVQRQAWSSVRSSTLHRDRDVAVEGHRILTQIRFTGQEGPYFHTCRDVSGEGAVCIHRNGMEVKMRPRAHPTTRGTWVDLRERKDRHMLELDDIDVDEAAEFKILHEHPYDPLFYGSIACRFVNALAFVCNVDAASVTYIKATKAFHAGYYDFSITNVCYDASNDESLHRPPCQSGSMFNAIVFYEIKAAHLAVLDKSIATVSLHVSSSGSMSSLIIERSRSKELRVKFEDKLQLEYTDPSQPAFVSNVICDTKHSIVCQGELDHMLHTWKIPNHSKLSFGPVRDLQWDKPFIVLWHDDNDVFRNDPYDFGTREHSSGGSAFASVDGGEEWTHKCRPITDHGVQCLPLDADRHRMLPFTNDMGAPKKLTLLRHNKK